MLPARIALTPGPKHRCTKWGRGMANVKEKKLGVGKSLQTDHALCKREGGKSFIDKWGGAVA